jgi:hypothetical protein
MREANAECQAVESCCRVPANVSKTQLRTAFPTKSQHRQPAPESSVSILVKQLEGGANVGSWNLGLTRKMGDSATIDKFWTEYGEAQRY